MKYRLMSFVSIDKTNELIALEIWKIKILEVIRFDSKIASFFLFLAYWIWYQILNNTKKTFESIIIVGKIFRHIQFDWSRRYATNVLTDFIDKHDLKTVAPGLLSVCNPDDATVRRLKGSLLNDPRPFDKRIIILSPPEGEAKGVLLVKFTEYFKYFSSIFDLDRLSKDYVLVLEPSSAGYLDENILHLLNQSQSIIVQTPEPVDRNFLNALKSNLIPIEIGANCWVDKRVFYPIDGYEKVYDIIMVGYWGNKKRYHHLFEALSKMKKKRGIKIALVGVPWRRSMSEIREIAKYYKVEDCIEFYENLSQKELNVLLNKSKLFLLLSKKEGCNKAMIEAMYANVPVAILKGFNFGYHYPHINQQTGLFIPARGLAEFIETIDELLNTQRFSPREWVSKFMSPELSIGRLIDALAKLEVEAKIKINKNLQIKINNPDYDYVKQSLWNEYAMYYKGLQTYFLDAKVPSGVRTPAD